MSKWFRFLRKNEPLSAYFFVVPQFSLNLMGFWPSSTSTALSVRTYVNFVVLAIGVVLELHAGFHSLGNHDLATALETFCPASTKAVTLLKMSLMLHYRHDLAQMWSQLRSQLFESPQQRPDQHRFRLKHSCLAARISCWPVSAGLFTAFVYNVKPLLFALVLYLQNRVDEIPWDMPYNMTLPKFLLEMPFFPFTFIFNAYSGYVTIFLFSGCDGYYFEFCSHIADLFEVQQSEARAMFEPYQEQLTMDAVQAEHLEEQLRALIIRHNTIFDLTRRFREHYVVITMAHFVSASMVIGFSLINLMTLGGNGLGALLYVAYTVAAASQLLVYCYGGTLVAESSLGLCWAVSSCPWNICLPKQRRFLHLLILRSQRPMTMTVPFFSPSLAAFASILQTSGSIIALFKSFQ
ncbi:hypothetical protein KR018_007444 [Drosophila ironensis]|nr:hypothetical protein KR018_007444 [Drosophila ironensis]